MKNYIDVGIVNYVVFNTTKIIYAKKLIGNTLQGFWKMSFDGACCKFKVGVCIVFKIPLSCIYPHVIRLEFHCTNNEAEHEELIQGLPLKLLFSGDIFIVNHQSYKKKVQDQEGEVETLCKKKLGYY